MTGVLIRDMELPKRCDECPCCVTILDRPYCAACNRALEETGPRETWCPMEDAGTWFSHHPGGNIYARLP